MAAKLTEQELDARNADREIAWTNRTLRTERDAHADLMRAAERQRMRAGFAVQGPYRRRPRSAMRWVLAFLVVAVLITWRLA